MLILLATRLRVEAELERTRTIDGGHECRGIDLLLQMRIGDAGKRGDAPAEFLRHAQVGRPVVADGANVDLCRQPEIEDLGDHVGGLEIEGHVGEGGRQCVAQLAHVAGGWRVTLLERYQDHAVIGADGRTVGECEVIRSLRHPDVVDDQVAIARRE